MWLLCDFQRNNSSRKGMHTNIVCTHFKCKTFFCFGFFFQIAKTFARGTGKKLQQTLNNHSKYLQLCFPLFSRSLFFLVGSVVIFFLYSFFCFVFSHLLIANTRDTVICSLIRVYAFSIMMKHIHTTKPKFTKKITPEK